jgi:hypothetical protein
MTIRLEAARIIRAHFIVSEHLPNSTGVIGIGAACLPSPRRRGYIIQLGSSGALPSVVR